MKLSRAAIVLGVASAVLIATGSLANDELQSSGTVQASAEVGPGPGGKPSLDADGRAVYIVQFENPPLAMYDGGIDGFQGTSRKATGNTRLDTRSKAAQSYVKLLQSEQNDFLTAMGSFYKSGKADVKFTYQHAFNGVAMKMTAAQAASAANMPGVLRVSRERFYEPTTDAGPDWIDAPFIWTGPPNNVPHSRGEGVVIGVLDTGINFDHPSFADLGGDGFDHTNPLGSGSYVPGSYCDVTDPNFCNDKLIGAWTFVPGDPAFPTPEATDRHGVHTASTAGGNVVNNAAIVAPTTSFVRNVSGVAPHANLISYDVCVASCPGSALVAAVNQVVIDNGNLPNGIAAINYSISGGTNPYSDTVELGFLGAASAGVYVSASAGNSGPGAGTLGHQSPWVATVGASTHNRAIDNSLINLNSDAASLADIVGAGLTAGFGPAPIIHARDFPTSNGSSNDTNPGQCLAAFPAGHFNNEIVICDRGSIARVAKGANVLAGGAGGFVLANTAAQGESIVGDGHFLPGVHIGFSDAQVLDAWRTSNTNPVATISGFSVNLDPANGDVVAGFSSRGPNTAFDVLKPDISTPGVNVMAAWASDGSRPAPEFGFLSGTSMAAPHSAGSAALLAAVKPNWSPHQIKSALMLTATNANTVKEDGVTPTDPFDVGAGRVNLQRAQEVGLTLDETNANFLAADPNLGGDPKTLNVASMQDSACVGNCSWTRTVKSDDNHTTHWDLSASGPPGLNLSVSNSTGSGNRLKLKGGQSATITVTADSVLASPGWNFAELNFDRKGDGPDLHMPIAVRAALSSDANLLNKTVSSSSANPGDILTYAISITQGQLAGTINLTDVVPAGTTFVSGSETEVVSGGATSSPWAYNAGTNSLSWSGTLNQSSLALTSPVPATFGYFPLSTFFAPFALPGNCDDGGWILNVPTFTFNNAPYNQVIWSVNGTLEAGTASGLASGGANQNMPSAILPNNLMGALWTDLNLCVGGNWYVGNLLAGPRSFTVYEWENVPLFSNNALRYTVQIWVERTAGFERIWYVYQRLDSVAPNMTVGVEDMTGTLGSARYFNGSGTPPATGAANNLLIVSTPGGSATLGFQAQADCSVSPIVNRANLTSGSTSETAIAFSTCP